MNSTSQTPAESSTPTSPPAQQTHFAQKLFSTIISSPVSIAFSCLVVIGILTVLIGCLLWAVRAWQSRRRRNQMDEDTRRILEAPEDFRCHFVDFQSQPPAPSFVDKQLRTGFVRPLAVAPPAPVPTRSTGLDSTIAQVDRAIISMEGSQFSYGSPNLTHLPRALGGKFTRHSSIVLRSSACKQEGAVGTHDKYFQRANAARKLNNRATIYVSPVQSPAPRFIRPAPIYIPLAREASLTSSEHEWASIEALRATVTDRRSNLRATLRGAIQKDREDDEEFLESLKIIWNEGHLQSQKTIDDILQTAELVSTQDDAIPSAYETSFEMHITATQGSCYSVEGNGL